LIVDLQERTVGGKCLGGHFKLLVKRQEFYMIKAKVKCYSNAFNIRDDRAFL
jgi:hypothetical protein